MEETNYARRDHWGIPRRRGRGGEPKKRYFGIPAFPTISLMIATG